MRKTIFLILILSFSMASPSFALSPRIEGLDVRYSSDLRFSFVVKDAFTKDMEEAIKSGIPTSFTFIVKLHREKNLWPDELIGAWRFNRVVKYDALKNEYAVTMGEKNVTERTDDPDVMKSFMTTGSDIMVSPLPLLKKDETYELSLKAQLDPIELPFLLNYMLFFVKMWDFETGWQSYRFSI